MKSTTITFRLTEQEKAAIMEVAQQRDIPFSQLIREAIRKYIQEEDKKNGRQQGSTN
jgi:predicted transcriptional regulator